MYMVQCENTLRIEAIECINNESLDWLWCMCASRLQKIVKLYIITFKRYFKCILGVQIWCSIVRAQLLGERPKGKYSTAKQLNGPRMFKINGPRMFKIVLKLGKLHLFRWIHTKPIFYANLFPSCVWNTNIFIHITLMDGWKSNWDVLRGLSRNFQRGLST